MAGINLNGLINRIELNDLGSIQKVIQYFPLISEVERQQTVIRITNALIRLREKVVITEHNPIFKYLKPGTYAKAGWFINTGHVFIIDNTDYDLKIVDSLDSYITSISSIHDGVNVSLNSIFKRCFAKDVIEVYNVNNYHGVVQDIINTSNYPYVWYMINNIIMNYCNKKIMSFMEDSGQDIYQLSIINALFLDINEALIRHERKISITEIVGNLKVLSKKLDYLPIEVLGLINFILLKEPTEDTRRDLIELKHKVSDSFMLEDNVIAMIRRETSKDPLAIFNTCLHGECVFVTDVLEKVRAKRELELNEYFDDILSSKRYSYNYQEIKSDGQYAWLIENLEFLATRDLTKFKKSLDKRLLKTTIPDTQMYALKSNGIISRFIRFPHQDLILGISKKTCYILTSNCDKVYMFPIFNGNEQDKVRRIELMDEPLTVRIITFSKDKVVDLFPTDLMVIEATRNIEFDKDTNLKFNFKKADNNTYMNRYSDIHTVLVQNSRNKNYQAMKTDLCRLYALIYVIERDVTHSTKAVSPSVKADGSKARMFAKNDLKRYLAEVTAHEKDFDLAKYFNESDIKKEIEKEYAVKINALGVKKLLKTFI